jgi:hypothetical protein
MGNGDPSALVYGKKRREAETVNVDSGAERRLFPETLGSFFFF